MCIVITLSERRSRSMSRPQPSSTFVVPQAPARPAAAPKAQSERKPFVIVPASLVTDDRDKLEPHWLLAIDAATD
jgi:hypothetical protein